ncbi:MAG: ABC transporter substrate-binding protein [Flavobacteriaceae bacterium]|nr:ABC transporter substrate-binding protein [Flavobacteriaceae bacterium]
MKKHNILKISRELKTGVLILTCITIFIFGFNYLKGTSLFDNSKIISALYTDVEGLVIGANVTINGMNVGKVKNIDFNENYEKIMVTFSLRNDLTFSNQSKAQLYEAGLIGGKAIAIIPIYEDGNVIKNGDVLPSDIKPGLTELVNQQIAPLQDKIEGLLTSADSLFAGVSNVMNYETQNNLKLALEGLTESFENVAKLTKNMNQIVKQNERNFKGTMDNLKNTSKNLNQLTDSLTQIPFNSTINNIEQASEDLKTIISRLELGSGTFGKLLNEDEFYNKLLGSSEALEALLNDLKDNPKKYVHFSIFGRKEKEK